MDYLDCCVDITEKSISIREAMLRVDELKTNTLFFTKSRKLVSVLTAGDIRRYLLDGGKVLDDSCLAVNNRPKYARNKDEAKLIFEDHSIAAVPILNEKNEIIEIYCGEDSAVKPYPSLGITVVINAGGKGTRLEPLTSILPKPLIPVGKFPIIEHIMREFEKYSCNNFHFIVNYKKQLIKAYFNENDNKYLINYYDEEEPLGTGGGLSFLKGKIKETFFLSNCDVLIRTNYKCILDFHKKNKNTITMVCAYKHITIPYGVVEMGENGAVLEMTEKPEISFLTNTGMYIVEPDVLDDIEDNVSVGFPDIIEQQRKNGKKVAVYPISENEWMDMGQMSGLEEMNNRLMK